MVKHDACWLRSQRIAQIKKDIFAVLSNIPERKAPRQKMVLMAMVNIGLTKAKAEEYIDLILESSPEQIEQQGENLCFLVQEES